jgi:hypothetical protein
MGPVLLSSFYIVPTLFPDQVRGMVYVGNDSRLSRTATELDESLRERKMHLDAPINDIVGMGICLIEALIDSRSVVVIVDRNSMLNQLRQSHIYAFFSRHGAGWKKGASRGEDRILMRNQILSEFDVYSMRLYRMTAEWERVVANASRFMLRESI